jgi:hypothetical protein
MPKRRQLTLCLAAALAAPALVRADTTPEALAERLLGALGGREAWARARNSRNDSQQNRSSEPTVVRSVITLDFTAPRFRIEISAPGIAVARAVDHERHWRRTRDGTVGPIPADALADERRWYAAHVYRTLHRLAVRDAALAVQSPRAGQLDVIEGGRRLAWYRLDSRGEPYLFGAHEGETGTVCGPWEFEASGIRHPLWTASPDGTWRALLKALAVNVPMPDTLLAAPPP